ncbi:hypothetical protein [Marinimicrobium sp. ARAG 43.8]|uniref:hypothetical protein n=1 Tax=Marinimicrobium sp. ARAG 43.8 TaxID=3418719 RepID=UPI003CEBAD8F
MTYTGNNRVGITVYEPGDLLTLSLLSNIQVTTYNNGVQQESTNSGSLLGLTLLDVFDESDWSMIIVESTLHFLREYGYDK